MARDSHTAASKRVAKVVVDANGAHWSGKDAISVRNWLRWQPMRQLGGEFDENNMQHWKKLSGILSGSRFWAVDGKE